MPLLPLRLVAATAFFLVWSAVHLAAFDGPEAFTLDLPFAPGTATPGWLGLPQVPDTTFATLNLPIQPPDTSSYLLVTIFFQEKSGGFLRLTWSGSEGAQVLSDNFYEGIGMSNQRSLLVSPDILQSGGTLTLQCGDSTLDVQRVRLQWLQSQSGLVSPEIRDTLVTPSVGATQLAENLNGQPKLAVDPAWYGQLVVVPVTDAPERIEDGVEFSVALDSVPSAGRLALQENGLPWGKHLVVWVNRQRAGTITPAVPDLNDDGFLAVPEASTAYVGWRKGSLYLPVSLLKTGVNTLQFSDEDEWPASSAADTLPLAVKDVELQLIYPASSPAATGEAESEPAPAAETSADSTPPDSLLPQSSPAPLSLPTTSSTSTTP